MGKILTDIVNFFAHDIPTGIKTSIEQINSVITAYNNAAAARDAAAAKPSAMAPGAGTGLLGDGDKGSKIPTIETNAVIAATKVWAGYADVQGVVAGAVSVTTAAQKASKEAGDAVEQSLRKQEALWAGLRTPMEQYEQNLKRIKDAHAEGELGARAHMQANALLAGEFLNLADTAAGALGTLFKDSKGVAIAQAVINTAQAITATLAQNGATPWGLVAAGVAAASGAAQIATIMSTQPGTSKKPSAGSKGSGSKPAKESAGSSGGTQTMKQAVSINLMGSGGFSRDQVRQLAQQLNGLVADGASISVN
jgi:hypothetical protein